MMVVDQNWQMESFIMVIVKIQNEAQVSFVAEVIAVREINGSEMVVGLRK